MQEFRTKLLLIALDNFIWVMIAVLCVINAIYVPKFVSYNNVINIFYHVSALGLLVLAEGIVLIGRQLDLSIESTVAFAPGVAILTCNTFFLGVSPIIQIALTFIIGMGVGMFNGVLVTKLKMNSLLETIAMMIILRGLVFFLLPFSIIDLAPGYVWAGFGRTVGKIPVAVFILIGTYIFFAIIMERTKFGRFLIATGGNPTASYIAGVKVDKMIISSFVLAGFLASLSGLLIAGRQGSIGNSMGNGLVLHAFAGAVLGGVSFSGGRGTVLGMFGGMLLLSLFDNFLNLLAVNVYLVKVIKGSLILFAVLLDSVKTPIRALILHKEKVRELMISRESPKTKGLALNVE